MIYGRFINNPEDAKYSEDIIKEVFEHELGVPAEYDDGVMSNKLAAISTDTAELLDAGGQNTGLYVGTGRLTYDLDYFVIDNVCVLRDYRRMGYGDFIIRILTDKAIQCGARSIYAYCPENIAELFKNIGFKMCGSTEAKPPCYGIKFPHSTNIILLKLNPADFCTQCGHR